MIHLAEGVPSGVPRGVPLALPAPDSAPGLPPGQTAALPTTQTARHSVPSQLSALHRRLDVLDAVSDLRQLTSGQIQRLFFADGKKSTRERKCRRFLTGAIGKGIIKPVERDGYGLQGFTFVRGDTPASDMPAGRNWHAWAIAELYVGLIEAERAGLCQIVGFDREIPAPGYTFRPDLQVELKISGLAKNRRVWIEVDNSNARIAEKVKAYDRAFHDWDADRKGTFPGILFSGWDDAKCGVIRGIVKRVSRTPNIYRVCHRDIAVNTILS